MLSFVFSALRRRQINISTQLLRLMKAKRSLRAVVSEARGFAPAQPRERATLIFKAILLKYFFFFAAPWFAPSYGARCFGGPSIPVPLPSPCKPSLKLLSLWPGATSRGWGSLGCVGWAFCWSWTCLGDFTQRGVLSSGCKPQLGTQIEVNLCSVTGEGL